MRPTSVAHGFERAARCADDAGQPEAAPGPFLLVADDFPEDRLGGAQVERQPLVLLLQAPDLGSAPHRQQQLVGLPGLEQVLPDTGLVDPGDDVLGVGVAGEDDAHDIRPALADFAQELHAGRHRHALVAQHDADAAGGVLAFEDLERDRGGGGAEHLEILLQRPAQGFQRTRLVIDDENRRQLALTAGGIRRNHAGIFQSRSRWRAR